MQRWQHILGTLILIMAMGLLACGTTAAEPASSGAQAAVSPTPDTAVYWDLVAEAQTAYDAGEFEEAMALARQAAAIRPDDNSAWTVFQDAAVAAAADDYLQTLPERRYRIKPVNYLADLVNGKEYFVVDVRETKEFDAGHIEGAVNVPLRNLTQELEQFPDSRTMPVLVYCQTQKRATHALVVLRELGFSNVYNLEGGYVAYVEWIATNPTPTPGPTATPEPEGPSC